MNEVEEVRRLLAAYGREPVVGREAASRRTASEVTHNALVEIIGMASQVSGVPSDDILSLIRRHLEAGPLE